MGCGMVLRGRPGCCGVSSPASRGGTAFAAGEAVGAEEGAGFLPLPCCGAAIASLKVTARVGSPCRDGFLSCSLSERGADQREGLESPTHGVSMGGPPAAAEIGFHMAVPTGFKEHHQQSL